MANMKQESIEKARGIKSPSPSPMVASRLSPQATNNSSRTSHSGEDAAAAPKPYVPVDIHQFQPPPPTPTNRQQSVSPLSGHRPPGVPSRSSVSSPSPPSNQGPPVSLPPRSSVVVSPPPRPPNAHSPEQVQEEQHPANFKLIDIASVGPPPPKTFRPPQEQTQRSHLPSYTSHISNEPSSNYTNIPSYSFTPLGIKDKKPEPKAAPAEDKQESLDNADLEIAVAKKKAPPKPVKPQNVVEFENQLDIEHKKQAPPKPAKMKNFTTSDPTPAPTPAPVHRI
ncbi:unnamed protein product [[Candida] boidinii]|nr:unnamed protein product [[Candida] boidinii]